MSESKNLVVPELGESITEAVISRWLKSVGDTVAADEPVVDLETDKITVQLPAPAAGQLLEQRHAEGTTVRVGDIVGTILAGAGAHATPAAKPTAQPAAPVQAATPEVVPPRSPEPASEPTMEARSAAETGPAAEAQIEADALKRLTPAQRRAVRLGEAELPSRAAPPEPRPSVAKAAPQPQPAASESGGAVDLVPMSPLRRRIAERLVQVQNETASLTTFNEVDMSAVMALRAKHQDAFVAAYGIKLGFMSFFVKACVAAAKLFPGLNAEIRSDAIAYKKHYDFGIAVSTERGLVVPVLRGVDTLGFHEIEQGIIDLAAKARDGKLTLNDLTGGTFTITNGGIFGSMLSTPILNYPQTGILGMHNIVKRPVAVGNAVEVRPVMYIALTYDHRVVDGREAVQFLVAVKDRIEQPERLLFGV